MVDYIIFKIETDLLFFFFEGKKLFHQQQSSANNVIYQIYIYNETHAALLNLILFNNAKKTRRPYDYLFFLITETVCYLVFELMVSFSKKKLVNIEFMKEQNQANNKK